MNKVLAAVFFGVLMSLLPLRAGAQNPHLSGDWYNCSFDRDGVYGAEIDKALEFLSGKQPGKKPVIALIGSGMDIEHEDLRHAIWHNPKEKPDGADNDGNGYVDDLYGWNFLTSKDGETLENTNLTTDREFFRLQGKYGNLFFWDNRDNKYVHISEDGKITLDAGRPENIEEFDYFRDITAQNTSDVAKKYSGWLFTHVVREFLDETEREMIKRYPGQELTKTMFIETAKDMAPGLRTEQTVALGAIVRGLGFYKGDSWEGFNKLYSSEWQEKSYKNYEKALAKADFGARQRILGDDVNNLDDYGYGNGEVMTFNARPDVMKAGVIAAKRGNDMGIDGIADFAQIMSLVTYSGQGGEPYVKDMVLAIRYAVDNGADIIVLSYQSRFYSPQDKRWMYDALRYAGDKGVLVISPVWETSANVDRTYYFPNRFMGERELDNFMVVSMSDAQGNPAISANYGEKGVDLFAPSVNIRSTDVGDTYITGTATQLGAGVLAGVAALVKGYYPHLTGSQIRDLLNETVTSRKGVEVPKNFQDLSTNRIKQDLFLFDELCLSGGIVNAYNAVVKADKMKR